VDAARILALVGGPLSDPSPVLAKPLQPDTHDIAPARSPAAASRRRETTNSGSRLASSQPARGPFGRPRNARYSAAKAAFGSMPAAVAVEKMASCQRSPPTGGPISAPFA